MLNPPRPGSLLANTSTPPPESCSPLSGKSSSKTLTESFAVGNGSPCTSTATAVWPGATGSPPMLWPHVDDVPFRECAQVVVVLPVWTGLAASGGETALWNLAVGC